MHNSIEIDGKTSKLAVENAAAAGIFTVSGPGAKAARRFAGQGAAGERRCILMQECQRERSLFVLDSGLRGGRFRVFRFFPDRTGNDCAQFFPGTAGTDAGIVL